MGSKTVLLFILLVTLSSAVLGARFIVPVEGMPGIREIPGVYETIQAAIDAANPGDIIQVASGTYNECITINKQLTLVGEDSSTTIINSSGTYHVVYVTADNVYISGFTIQNGIFQHEPGKWSYFNGILLRSSSGSTISGNIIVNNFHGIFLERCSGNIISDNTITNNQYGIRLYSSSGNTINGNTVSNNIFYGLYLYANSHENIISGNNISNNKNGTYLSHTCGDNTFYHNNFINNTNQAYNEGSVNTWDNGYPSGGNYWSDYTGVDVKSGPNQYEPSSDGIGDTAYVIDENNRDRYPLMYQWPDTTSPTTIDDYYDGVWHTTDFTVTLIATDDKSGVKETYYKINDVPTKSVSTHGQPLITTESADNKLEYWSVDNVGNEEFPHKILTGIKLDKTAPTGSITINNDAAYANSISVTLTLTATDATSGVAQMHFSNEGTTWTEWEIYSTSKSWTLPIGDDTKTVYVQFKDNAGLISSPYHDTIILDTTKPTADAGPYQTVAEDTLISFDGSASWDENGIASYTWTFTDVTAKTLSGEKPTYTFNTPSVYTITLNVTDPAGNWATDMMVITVLDITKPVANAGQNQTVKVGETITFDASGSSDNVGIVSYEWTFGDGTTGTGIIVNHTYANPVNYTVTLTVRDAAGNTDIDYLTVTVKEVTTVEEVFPWWIVGAAAAVIVVAVAATILWRRRK